MPISGDAVFTLLRQGYDNLKRAGQTLATEGAAANGRLREALDRLNEAVNALARHYLPELSRSSVEVSFAEVRHDLFSLLAQQEQARQLLVASRAAQTEKQQAQRAELDAVTGRLNEKVKQREALEVEAARRLAQQSEFQQLSRDMAQAEERLAQNERRLADVERDAAEKLPAYQQSRLFTYLHGRRYGTSEYRGSGLFRRLDRWVAEHINYAQLRRSFEFLSVTPRLMATELASRRQVFESLMSEAQKWEQRVAAETGLAQVLAEGFALGEQRDGTVAEIAATGKHLDETERQLAELSGHASDYYERGIARLREFLKSTPASELLERARQTRDPADDPLAASLVSFNENVSRLQQDIEPLQHQVSQAEAREASLRSLLEKFQQANFDSDRSSFHDGFAPERLLAEFTGGKLDALNLWRQLAAAQSFRPMRSPHFLRDNGMPPQAAVILGALLEALGGALEQTARRGVNRRWPTGSGPSFPSWPRPDPPQRPGGGGGFTTGDGF